MNTAVGTGRFAIIRHRGYELGVTVDDENGTAHYRLDILGGPVADTPLGSVTVDFAAHVSDDLDPVLLQRLRIDVHELRHQVAELAELRAALAAASDFGLQLISGWNEMTGRRR
ncbi:hypothetical protein [Glycomyces sp. YM15]|uniref:hypothetical protein n=1 Tax=Glycomyces sp. YM15 TaxID=2800446 RepID=UPI0019627229|nr:hypothetical protein [Glycomyces sp. YM15]